MTGMYVIVNEDISYVICLVIRDPEEKKYMRTYSYMQEDYNRVWSLETQKIKIPVIDGKNVLKT